MKIVKVSHFSYSYPDGRQAFSDINFSLTNDSSLGIIGPNGAGKTSLLLALCGLINAKGDVNIFQKRMTVNNTRWVRKKISFVFQNPDDQLFMPTVYEDVAFGLPELGCSANEVRIRVKQALKAVGLSGFEDRSSHHCSYGEKRKITLAIALARQSSLLIFDEPTRELDPGGRREFIKLLKGINATKIIASHDLDLIWEICIDVVLINRGQLITKGLTRNILNNSNLMEANNLEIPCHLRFRQTA